MEEPTSFPTSTFMLCDGQTKKPKTITISTLLWYQYYLIKAKKWLGNPKGRLVPT